MLEKITILVDKNDWWKLTECGWESTGKYAPVDGRLIMVRREANARLIAAAPEMFESLQEAVKSCPCSLRERDSGHRVDCYVPRALDVLAHVEATNA